MVVVVDGTPRAGGFVWRGYSTSWSQLFLWLDILIDSHRYNGTCFLSLHTYLLSVHRGHEHQITTSTVELLVRFAPERNLSTTCSWHGRMSLRNSKPLQIESCTKYCPPQCRNSVREFHSARAGLLLLQVISSPRSMRHELRNYHCTVFRSVKSSKLEVALRIGDSGYLVRASEPESRSLQHTRSLLYCTCSTLVTAGELVKPCWNQACQAYIEGYPGSWKNPGFHDRIRWSAA